MGGAGRRDLATRERRLRAMTARTLALAAVIAGGACGVLVFAAASYWSASRLTVEREAAEAALRERLSLLEARSGRERAVARQAARSGATEGAERPEAPGGEPDDEAGGEEGAGALAALEQQVRDLTQRVEALERDPVSRGYAYLGSESAALRREGVRQLRRLARSDPAALAAIREMLRDADPAVRREAVEALGDLEDKESRAAIATLLGDADAEVRRRAVMGLADIGGGESAASIAGALADPSERVREEAADALGELRSPEARDALLKALGDASEDVRGEAIASLGEIGAREAAAQLRGMYENDPGGAHLTRLVLALRNLGDEEPFARELDRYSRAALGSQEAEARRLAIRALASFAGREAKDVFTRALEDSSSLVRREAERALRQD
jgi:HEAT repeat protein